MHAAGELELIRALVGQATCSPAAAADLLDHAAQLGVDPLELIVHRHGIDTETLHARIADWLGLPYCANIVPFIAPYPPDIRIDALAEMRSVRGLMGGRDVLFIAPRFGALMALGRQRDEIARRLWIVSPTTLRVGLATVNADLLLDNATQRLARRAPWGSANLALSKLRRAVFVVALVLVVTLAMVTPLVLQPVFLPVLTVFLAAPSVFRLWAAFTAGQNLPLNAEQLLEDADLPIYSVLIPLRDEAHMVPQIAAAMRRLDYPPEKLDIVFVVESSSPGTVMAVRRQLDDPRLGLIVVPRRLPFTKPKALNFALPLMRGGHVVVFDAEDVPDRLQLRKAASLFAQRPDLDCLQAELLIANTGNSWIARMFAAEYAGHFGVMLPAITRMGFPMPLGGTSNHFRTEVLRSIGAWDAFNVTEDADLGVRLARLGHKSASFLSWTAEEAPETMAGWLKQRTRWMKGWMQTLIVHNSHPRLLRDMLGWRNMVAFEVFVGGMVISIALHAVFLMVTAARFGIDIVTSGAAGLWSGASLIVLLLGYWGAAASSIIGLDRIGRPEIAPILVRLPLYWLMGWVATVRAAIELLHRPWYWAKTHHRGPPSPTIRAGGRAGARARQQERWTGLRDFGLRRSL